jgi:hypothetical protein
MSGVMRSMNESFTCAGSIPADFDLLLHLDLWPEHVELESVKTVMVIIAEGLERELMRKIE